MLISLSVFFSGCGFFEETPDTPKEEVKLKLNYYSYTLNIYEGFNLLSTNFDDVSFSSENEQVAKVDTNGYVFALSAGSTSITVKSGDLSASCLINVNDNEIKPYIITNVEEFNLYVNDEFVVQPKLYFSQLLDDAIFTFETENDCITVDNYGKVKAIRVGETSLTVKSIFYNIEITKVININVVSNISINVDKSEFAIMKNDSLGGEISFSVDNIKVYNDTGLIENAETYYKFDETLLSRNGNTFTALNTNGKTVDENTIVYVCYDFDDVICSCQINVKINFPIKDIQQDAVYYVDNWKDNQKISEKKIGKDNLTFGYDIFNGEEIVKVYTIINGAEIDLLYENGTLGTNNLSKGNFVWKVCNKDFGYLISVSVVDFVCFDSQSFAKIVSVATDETIVLATDLTSFGELTRANQNTFSGILDGNGHKITDMKLGEMHGGIFYNCNGAVIKNLSLLNIESTARFGEEYSRGVLASTISNTKISNVCIDAFSKSSCEEGVLARKISQGVSVQNVVINYRTSYKEHGQTTAICYVMDSMFSEVNGLYVICPESVDLVYKQLQIIDNKEVVTTTPFVTVQDLYDFFNVNANDYLIKKYNNNSSLKYDLEELEGSDIFSEVWEN